MSLAAVVCSSVACRAAGLALVRGERLCGRVVGEGVEDAGCVQYHDAFGGCLNFMGSVGIQFGEMAGDVVGHFADDIRKRGLTIEFRGLTDRLQGVVQINGDGLRRQHSASFGMYFSTYSSRSAISGSTRVARHAGT